ncbi:MAG: RluA family pseudouridine synthase [Acidobacteria bacterium]|nr:RluA family pseudouridine synthase [Acidobacteriota bacterium]
MSRVQRILPPELEGERLDRALAALTGLSRRRARTLIREGKVARNGKPLKVEGRLLGAADVLEIILEAEDEVAEAPFPEAPELSIVHRDRWLVAVDKPSGMLSQPAASQRPGDLAADQVLLRQLAGKEGQPPFLRLVHRLDRVTSGLLLFAAHPQALAPLDRAWRGGEVERIYLALVEGEAGFEGIEVDAPITRAPGGSWRFQVAEGGQPAKTAVERLAAGEGASVLRCRLLTGRTHQVRVHLAHLGLPVLGDTLYGARKGSAPRPLLHAYQLHLPHPRTRERLVLEAPIPEDFRPLLDRCQLSLP